MTRVKKAVVHMYGIEVTKPHSKVMYEHNDMVAKEMRFNITDAWANEMIKFNKTDEWPSDGSIDSAMHTIQSSICATGFGDGFTIDEVHTDFMSNLSDMANWQLHEEYSYMCSEKLVPRTAFTMLGFNEAPEYHEPCHDKTVLVVDHFYNKDMNLHVKGYQPKIEYWTKMLSSEMFNTKQPDFERVLEIKEKLTYFCNRQLELNDSRNDLKPTFV